MKAEREGDPGRRLAPRPLPAHLASALMLWLSSRAALPILKNVSPLSSEVGEQLRRLAGEIDACGSDEVAAALDQEVARRAENFIAGLEAYRRHSFQRGDTEPPVLWREGTTRLLDYGGEAGGPVVLVVPSLINRYYVLDLLPERSFLRHLASQGLRPVVVDWGAPGRQERDFALTDYIGERLESAFAEASRISTGKIGVLGYCMGGLLALALALRRQAEIGCLALLATPWDFHAGHPEQAKTLAVAAEALAALCGPLEPVPVEVIQTLFLMLDPFSAERKFTRFAALDPAGEEARSFVALEDWLNDGVPLPQRVARECARSWYADNQPGRGSWRVGGQVVDPRLLRCPALVVVPAQDRIVPPSSARRLAAELTQATVMQPSLGHVGMMAAARSPAVLWTPVGEWLRSRLGEE